MSVLLMQASLLINSSAIPYDPDAQSIIDRMIPDPAVSLKERLNAFIVALKNPALWGSGGALFHGMDMLYVPATAQNSQSGLLDWRRPVSATLHGGATFSQSLGFSGTGIVGSYADLQYVPNSANFTQNSASLTIIVTRPDTSTGSSGMMGVQATRRAQISRASAANGYLSTVNSAATTGAVAVGAIQATGDIVTGLRDNSSQDKILLNGAQAGTRSQASTATPTAASMYALGINGPNATSDCALGLMTAGRAITATEQATLKALYQTYVSAA